MSATLLSFSSLIFAFYCRSNVPKYKQTSFFPSLESITFVGSLFLVFFSPAFFSLDFKIDDVSGHGRSAFSGRRHVGPPQRHKGNSVTVIAGQNIATDIWIFFLEISNS